MIDSFLSMAVWAALLAAPLSGSLGSLVIAKRIAFIAGSISHAVLAGMGCCLWLARTYDLPWLDPIYGAFISSVLAALLIGWMHLKHKQREDAVIAAIWSTGMAIGVIFLSITPGNNVEFMSFLFGNILWIQDRDLWLLLGFDLVLAVWIALKYPQILALAFDEEQAKIQGVKVRRLYMTLLSLVAISIVLLIQMIGTVLVIALLTLPALIAGLYTTRLYTMMGLATLLSGALSVVGIGVAYLLDFPPGATIALVLAATYLTLLPIKMSSGLKARDC
ncbi:MAG: hypothetical protein RL235_654 [Chlamydiota bacterium]|jgi:zinc transport system permease protein